MILDDQLGQTQAFQNFQNIEYGSFVTFIFCRPSQNLCTVDLDKNKRPATFSFRKSKVGLVTPIFCQYSVDFRRSPGTKTNISM